MSDHIPFEIQKQIMKKLPVKSVIQFRSVSKQWKSLIDSSKFIKNYHVNHTNPQHHLLVEYQSDIDEVKYISIIDDNTFPNHKFSVTYPQTQDFSDHFIAGCCDQRIAGSSQGIICIHCYDRCDGDNEDMAVLWNPTVRKTVGVVIPHLPTDFISARVFSFGVCPNTNEPKLVQLTVTIPSTLFNINVFWGHVCTQGFIYFLTRDHTGIGSNMIVLFDLRSEEFGQVYLPDSLLHSRCLVLLSKRNECLTLLETYNVDDVNVWMMNDSVSKSFAKIFTLKSLGHVGLSSGYLVYGLTRRDEHWNSLWLFSGRSRTKDKHRSDILSFDRSLVKLLQWLWCIVGEGGVGDGREAR
ncbi:putative F-box domain-containing protein [Tanacetum coccineum]